MFSLAYHSFAWLAQEEEVVDKMLTTKSCKRRTCENNTNFVKDVAASYPSSVCKEIKLLPSKAARAHPSKRKHSVWMQRTKLR